MRFYMNENENESSEREKSYVRASQMHKSMHIILCTLIQILYMRQHSAVHSTRSNLSFSAPYFELQRALWTNKIILSLCARLFLRHYFVFGGFKRYLKVDCVMEFEFVAAHRGMCFWGICNGNLMINFTTIFRNLKTSQYQQQITLNFH
jgi:hypothetical protein